MNACNLIGCCLQHDQVLERNGFFTDKHSTRRLPFSEKLAKKEKYQNLARIEPILYEDITSQKRAGQLQSTNRSFEEYQALRLCRGEQLRVMPFSLRYYLSLK